MPDQSDYLGAEGAAMSPSGNPSEYLAGGAGGGKAAGLPAALPGAGGDPTDPGKQQLFYKGLNVLGHGTEIAPPGSVSQPLTAGIAATPAPGGITTGPGGAVERGGAVGAGGVGAGGMSGQGASLADLISQALGAGGKTAEFLSRLSAGEGGTRGNVGGEGQIQRSDQSLSDRLRSMIDSASGSGSFNQTLRTAGPTSPLSDLDVLRENLPPGGGALSADTIQSLGPLASSLGLDPAMLSTLSAPQLADVLMGGTTAPLTAGAGVPGAVAGGGGFGTGVLGAGALAAVLGSIAAGTGNQDIAKAAQALGGAASGAGAVGAAAAGSPSLASMGGAAAVAAVLSLLADATGNEDFSKAASALGTVAGGVAGGVSAATGGAAAANAAASLGLGAGLSGGIGAASGAAGAMAIPLAVVSLADMFMGPDDGGIWGQALSKSMGDWPSFGGGWCPA